MPPSTWLTTAELAEARGRSRRATADYVLRLAAEGVRIERVKSAHGKPTVRVHRGDYERHLQGLPPANDDDR